MNTGTMNTGTMNTGTMADGDQIRCTVVVPCFNEVDAITTTVEQLAEQLEGAPGEAGGYEVLVVDDGSTDGSTALLEQLAGQHEALRVLHHDQNYGYGAAIKTGIRQARAELIVITDADGTYPAEAIPGLLEQAASADMVVGSRTGDRVSYPLLRRVPKLFLRAYTSWLVGRRIPDMNSGLRVFRRSIVNRYLRLLPDGFSLTTTLTVAMMRGRYQVLFTPIDYAPRIGRSKIQPIQDTLRFFQLILRTGMYFAPLRVLTPIVAVLGTLFTASLCYDVFVLENLTDKTMMLLLFTMNTALLALLADMIDKRGDH